MLTRLLPLALERLGSPHQASRTKVGFSAACAVGTMRGRHVPAAEYATISRR